MIRVSIDLFRGAATFQAVREWEDNRPVGSCAALAGCDPMGSSNIRNFKIPLSGHTDDNGCIVTILTYLQNTDTELKFWIPPIPPYVRGELKGGFLKLRPAVRCSKVERNKVQPLFRPESPTNRAILVADFVTARFQAKRNLADLSPDLRNPGYILSCEDT